MEASEAPKLKFVEVVFYKVQGCGVLVQIPGSLPTIEVKVEIGENVDGTLDAAVVLVVFDILNLNYYTSY